MTFFHVVVLGIVQGLTEFIPVSSTAHLLVAQKILNIPATDATFSFSVLVQMGTVVSLFLFFWKDLLGIAFDTLKNLGGLRKFDQLPQNAKLGWYIIIATIPALLAGYFFKDAVEALFKTPLIEAAIRFFTASLLLALAEYFDKKMRRLESMTWLDALIVGLFQIIAVFPGASRSGTTISGSMFRGFAREDAARFAFLMSIPVMLAAGSYEMLSVIERSGTRAFLPYLITGFITAAIVGWLAIKWLMNYLHNNKHSLYVFSAYCAVAGVIVLIIQQFSL
ncbi:undecaprenyl-diphosphatase UppP [Candidatus Villigracilis affinis]|uniref:undecaprenyl-diphosphatase UppP n=1 Tax=Candidatus Villigracilis affinis TaxID=3140682 RepID=UPI001D2486ED|nr:undecaprenyl-diphosphatase UppP [Anaerolineales bacterium]